MCEIYEIFPIVKNYNWGMIGPSSLIYSLIEFKQKDIIFQNPNPYQDYTTLPYSELWFGTHPNGESKINIGSSQVNIENRVSMSEWLGHELPFLFKVLSVMKPLSIQVHPSVTNAKLLHDLNPTTYPDSNHKPEMIIAVSTFTLLCGFRPVNELLYFLNESKTFRSIFKTETMQKVERNETGCIKEMFQEYICNENQTLLKQFMQELKQISKRNKYIEELILINESHPDDWGLFCYLFMNRIVLEPTEALFIETEVPHCYIFGEGIECMVSSDNVVRCGLTQKLKDLDTFLRIANFEPRVPKVTNGNVLNESCTQYWTPYFTVETIIITSKYILKSDADERIVLVMDGICLLQNEKEEMIGKKGSSFFLKRDSKDINVIPYIQPGQFESSFIVVCK
jgi:mannose-6-phosphate isomerase